MSITTTKDVFCDFCPVWQHGDVEITNRKARQIAQGQGWKQIKVDGKLKDICPKCQVTHNR